MPEVHYRLLLADANILIDLIHTEQLAVLSLLRNALGIKVYVADCAVQELSQERLAAPLESFGVAVVRTEDDFALLEQVERFKETARSLSEQDVTQLLLAQRERWTLWTNDQRLAREAKRQKVETCRLFGPLLHAVDCGVLPKADMREMIEAIREDNPWLSDEHFKEIQEKLR